MPLFTKDNSVLNAGGTPKIVRQNTQPTKGLQKGMIWINDSAKKIYIYNGTIFELYSSRPLSGGIRAFTINDNGTYEVLDTDCTLLITVVTGKAAFLNLPPALGNEDRFLFIYAMGNYTRGTIQVNGDFELDGTKMYAGDFVILQSDGTIWNILDYSIYKVDAHHLASGDVSGIADYVLGIKDITLTLPTLANFPNGKTYEFALINTTDFDAFYTVETYGSERFYMWLYPKELRVYSTAPPSSPSSPLVIPTKIMSYNGYWLVLSSPYVLGY